MNSTPLTPSLEAACSSSAYELAKAWSEQGNSVFALVERAAALLEQPGGSEEARRALHEALDLMRESPAEFDLLNLLHHAPTKH